MRVDKMKEKLKTHHFVVGILLILLAAAMVCNEIFWGGRLDMGLLLVIGLLLVVAVICTFKQFYTGIFFSLAFIVILSADELGIESLSAGTILLAALLLSIGFGLLFGKKEKKCEGHFQDEHFRETVLDDSSWISVRAAYAGESRKIISKDFKRGDIVASFAGVKIDMTQAEVPSGIAEINVNSSFSGIDLTIPSTWNVEVEAEKLGAGTSIKGNHRPDGSVTLRITGKLSCSGINIICV